MSGTKGDHHGAAIALLVGDDVAYRPVQAGSTTADAPANPMARQIETNKEEPGNQPADLTGTWKQTNSNDLNSYMEATISGDTIEVN